MKYLLPLMLCAVSLTACAESPAPGADGAPASGGGDATAVAGPAVDQLPGVEAGTAEARAVAAIRGLNPQVRIDHVGAAPLQGFRELIVGGQVIYISDDGRYLLQGALFDIQQQKDLSQSGLAAVRRDLLKTIPAKDRIIFAADKPEYTVSVFTDVECGYCRKLHGDIAEYNKRGISIEYLAYPRMGPASDDFRKMISVWCAMDRRQALTDAKADKSVPTRDCTNPVAMQYDIGQRVGLTGTPMIVTAEGMQMPGYMPPDALRAALDKLAAEAGSL